MIQSMTGYGKAITVFGDKKIQRGNQIVEQQSNGLIHTHRSIVS